MASLTALCANPVIVSMKLIDALSVVLLMLLSDAPTVEQTCHQRYVLDPIGGIAMPVLLIISSEASLG